MTIMIEDLVFSENYNGLS